MAGKQSTGLFSDPPHPFGGVHATTGAPIDARFPGQWFQAESGLHQNWMRDYDPTTGRYLQADPLGLVDGASVYGYGGQSPLANMDPTGQCYGPWALACAAAAGAAINVAIGYLYDELFGDGCYTAREAGFDAAIGAVTGGLGASVGGAAKGGGGADDIFRYVFPGVDKAAAKTAVDRMGLTTAQSAGAKSAVKRATGSSTVKVFQYGSDVVVQTFRQGRDGFQVFETIVTANGRKTVVQKAYDAAGRLVHLDPK